MHLVGQLLTFRRISWDQNDNEIISSAETRPILLLVIENSAWRKVFCGRERGPWPLYGDRADTVKFSGLQKFKTNLEIWQIFTTTQWTWKFKFEELIFVNWSLVTAETKYIFMAEWHEWCLDSTEVLTAVWTFCLINGYKTDWNRLVGRYDVIRRNRNSVLNAALFWNIIFKLATQVVLTRNCLRVNSHNLAKVMKISSAL